MANTTWESDGYAVYEGALAPEIAAKIARSLQHEALELALPGEDLKALAGGGDDDEACLLRLLTDPKLRERHLADPRCIWANGNTRQPIVGKANGMVNLFHNALVQQHITFNPALVERIAKLYHTYAPWRASEGPPALVFLFGPDRANLKPKGATAMPRHIDKNLFDNDGKLCPAYRVQCLVTLSLDPTADRDAGSLELLCGGFHHFFPLAGLFFQRIPALAASASDLPQGLPDAAFDAHLPAFRRWLLDTVLAPTALAQLPEADRLAIQAAAARCEPPLVAASQVPAAFSWRAIHMRPGAQCCWDSRLPHRNQANKTKTPRIAAYMTLYAAEEMARWQPKPGALLNAYLGEMAAWGHAGANRSGALERKIFGATAEQLAARLALPLTDTTRQTLAITYRAGTCRHAPDAPCQQACLDAAIKDFCERAPKGAKRKAGDHSTAPRGAKRKAGDARPPDSTDRGRKHPKTSLSLHD